MIAIVAAIREEVSEYLSAGDFDLASKADQGGRFYLSDEAPGVVVVESGIGRQAAQKTVARVLDQFAPETVVSAGFSAAARPGLETGDVFLCDRVWASEGSFDPSGVSEPPSRVLDVGLVADRLDSSLRGSASNYATGSCLTVPNVIATATGKRRAGEHFPVSVIDMESFWVCEAALDHGASALIVRSVFDPMELTLPSFIENATAGPSGNRYEAALRYAISHPTGIPELVRLWALSRRARSPLTKVLTALTSAEAPVPVG